ncbi:hypothetical protein LUZ63_018481 [Rhynchospora breviuscula]|uniref:Homeobox domain-containing protein n=1 Tax=Rhynchospora breviuscula TaxID=2022672 RepID=A0A9Q0C4F6_9POAL|nr:hypothetical protein LUZ63_018481 [Rhynchospora breviuscula]
MAAFYLSSTNQRDSVHSSYQDSTIPTNMLYDATEVAGNLLPISASLVSQSQFTGVPNAISNTEPDMGIGTQMMLLNGSAVPSQGLSLSLGSQIPVPVYQYRPSSSTQDFSNSRNSYPNPAVHTGMSQNVNSNSNFTNSISNSKYLKAAQELLDGVVNMKEALKQRGGKNQNQATASGSGGKEKADPGAKIEDNSHEVAGNSASDLSPSERQDLQNKVTKLLAMLDEVDRRYKRYYHQMQIVVSSFDTVAGAGSSKPYTALALQTISRHFRSLRDAITNQIQSTRKTLGESDISSKVGGISRLRYIDQQLRQQRAMQQFGMMQQNAWRPQRGLPESSVSILRAWLFEHFLHPYPKDSEKLLLARQTGLTRSQVSNWFINARVRLWKPMIEDMYKEEFGADAEIDTNSSSEALPANGKEEPKSSTEENENLNSPSIDQNRNHHHHQQANQTQFISFSTPLENCGPHANFQRSDVQENPGSNSHVLQDPRLMAYHMAEMGRYNGSTSNGGVSLTLGLQHVVQGEQIYGAGPHNSMPLGADGGDFEYMSMEDRQRFASSHLLHDFVA